MGKEGRVLGTRELLITGTTYTAVYRIIGERIEIAVVWHWAQSRKRR
jgi:plasmid stabilization system protein ParE